MQSSKGLEFRSVIFIGLGQIETSETQAAQNMKLLNQLARLFIPAKFRGDG